MGKLRVLVVFCAMAALLGGFAPSTVWACPAPCYWIGSAKVDDAWVPQGTAISAWIDGVQFGESTTGSLAGYDAWEFRIMVPPDDLMTPAIKEGGYKGDMVEFKILRPSDVAWLEAAIEPARAAMFVWDDDIFAWREVLLRAGSPPPAGLVGQVHLQGRPTAPHPSWVTPLKVVFFEAGTHNILKEANTTTDQWGRFTIPDVDSDFYDICLKSPRSLSERVENVGFPGGSPVEVDFVHPLREGDAKILSDPPDYVVEADVINEADYSVVLFYFGQTTVDALEKCDFNRDGAVNGLDFALLWMNFGQTGDCYPCGYFWI